MLFVLLFVRVPSIVIVLFSFPVFTIASCFSLLVLTNGTSLCPVILFDIATPFGEIICMSVVVICVWLLVFPPTNVIPAELDVPLFSFV